MKKRPLINRLSEFFLKPTTRLAPLLFLGDSHISYFRLGAKNGYYKPRKIGICEVGGATAVGMRNPNSKTNALAIFSKKLGSTKPSTVIITQLGEVDCGFVIWYRNKHYSENIEQHLNESIDAYFKFIDDTIAKGFNRIIITGAVLPTIRDGQDWGKVANKRREINVPLIERTRLTLNYNEKLRSNAEKRGLPYIDITRDILDPDTKIIRDSFRNPDSSDHHLNYALAASCWANRLNLILPDYD